MASPAPPTTSVRAPMARPSPLAVSRQTKATTAPADGAVVSPTPAPEPTMRTKRGASRGYEKPKRMRRSSSASTLFLSSPKSDASAASESDGDDEAGSKRSRTGPRNPSLCRIPTRVHIMVDDVASEYADPIHRAGKDSEASIKQVADTVSRMESIASDLMSETANLLERAKCTRGGLAERNEDVFRARARAWNASATDIKDLVCSGLASIRRAEVQVNEARVHLTEMRNLVNDANENMLTEAWNIRSRKVAIARRVN